MKEQKSWVKALHIDANQFASWVLQTPKHESVTFWCLDKGFLRANEYFAWAQEHYGLALLNESYFKNQPNRSLWDKIRTVANWSAEMLPLEEWDGVIFIGCVEPPMNVNWSFPVQYVLANAKDLKSHWENLQKAPVQPAVASASVAPAPLPAPAVEALDQTRTSIQMPAPKSTSAPQPAPAVAAATKTGIIEMPAPTAENTKTNVQMEPDAPTGLRLNFMNEKVLKVDPSIPEGISAQHLKKAETVTGFTVVAPVAQQTTTTATPIAPKSAAPTSATDGAINADKMAPTSVAAAKTEDEVIAWAFQQLKQYFRYTWLLTLTSDNLMPWRWEQTITPADDSALQAIDLQQPSLFRIVLRTKMPYHGHIVDSPVNSSFFKGWGLKNNPAHVTAVPLLSGSHLIAILLCAGDKPSDLDQVLRFAERTAITVSTNLGKKAAA